MFTHLFASMNEVLDDIIIHYPQAAGTKKKELHEKLNVLKAMSDSFIEQWLAFEEKLQQLQETGEALPAVSSFATVKTAAFINAKEAAAASHEKSEQKKCFDIGYPAKKNVDFDDSAEAFRRGTGYFQLLMFQDAVREFEQVVRSYPEFLHARLYLALAHMKSGSEQEAYRQFQLIVGLTDSPKMKAISLNAMGCVQMKSRNVELALDYFKQAHQTDPTSGDPLFNMGICQKDEGELKFGSELLNF